VDSAAEGTQCGTAWNIWHIFTSQELKLHFCHGSYFHLFLFAGAWV